MLPLKEATAEKHKLAERMPFNGLMFSGRLTASQYGEYLKSQLASLLGCFCILIL